MRRLLAAVLALLLIPAALALAAQSVTTGEARDVTSSSATATGTVDPDGRATEVLVEYGTTTQYGTSSSPKDVGSGTGQVAVEQVLTGLRPATTYHFRLVARSADGQVVGSDRTFTTAPAPAPTVTTRAASDVAPTAARLQATTDPGGAATQVVFDFGTSTAYGSTTAPVDAGAGTESRAVSAVVRGLEPGRTYHFRARARNASGEAVGEDRTFTTPRLRPPAASTGKVTDVSWGAAVVNGTINPRGRSGRTFLEYGTSSSRLRARTAPLPVSGHRQGVRLLVVGLKPRTRYFARVVVQTDVGVGRGRIRSFRTPAAPAAGRLSVTPSPVPYGRRVTISGRLTGPGAAGARVVLEGARHPFTAPLAPFGLETTADASGAFSLRTTATRRMRVRTHARLGDTDVRGALTAIRVRPGVRTALRRLADGRLRITGTIRPAGAYDVSVRRGGVRVKSAATSSARGVTRFRVTVRTPRAARYAVRVARRDRSLVAHTTRARRVAARP